MVERESPACLTPIQARVPVPVPEPAAASASTRVSASSLNTLYRELRCCRGVVATRFPFPRIDKVDSLKVPRRYQARIHRRVTNNEDTLALPRRSNERERRRRRSTGKTDRSLEISEDEGNIMPRTFCSSVLGIYARNKKYQGLDKPTAFHLSGYILLRLLLIYPPERFEWTRIELRDSSLLGSPGRIDL